MSHAPSLDWSKFNAVFVTRHAMQSERIHDLYRKNLKILQQIPYPKCHLQDPPALEYIILAIEQLKDSYDWIINIDDDAFLMDFDALYRLMEHMHEHQYDICGMADGLTLTPRDVFNPVSMNPFFNVIRTEPFRTRFTDRQSMLARYDPSEHIKIVPIEMYHPEIWQKSADQITGHEFPSSYEPYYSFFHGVLPKLKVLWLYGKSYDYDKTVNPNDVFVSDEPRRARTWYKYKKGILYENDPWTTVLYNHERVPFVYHTWYARNYGHGEDPTLPLIRNVDRIDRIYALACEKLGFVAQ